jgi:hypothetical protein
VDGLDAQAAGKPDFHVRIVRFRSACRLMHSHQGRPDENG